MNARNDVEELLAKSKQKAGRGGKQKNPPEKHWKSIPVYY
jgi:hypothetical protein